jgi:pimeloyl-ACP methyl ester carboxylesterase
MKQDRVRTDVLEIFYEEHGPTNGPPVILLHGFPYDGLPTTRSRRRLPPTAAACWCRGCAATARRASCPADAALGRAGGARQRPAPVHGRTRHRRAALCGYDWGGRAACVVGALARARALPGELRRLQHLQHRRLDERRPGAQEHRSGTSTISTPRAASPA